MSKLFQSLLALLLLLPFQNSMVSPDWIEQASRPGPNEAAIGQSRFDQLFLQATDRYVIPFPFERLIETLEAQLDNGKNPAVRKVLIPIGRSLQRDTPAPDYFRFPREVISYNDAAGRFEFHVVEKYAIDKVPRGKPANRVICMSCHHNAAPIFAQTPWRETSFNVEVATKLVSALPQRFNSLIGVVTLDAGVIDVLAERANYLSAAQAIWQQGCDTPACRAAMLRAVLQYRLSGKSNFDTSASGYQHDYFDSLRHDWSRKWPRGLALPGSRLPDRNPFAPDESKISHDPLLPRPAQAPGMRSTRSWQAALSTALPASLAPPISGGWTGI